MMPRLSRKKVLFSMVLVVVFATRTFCSEATSAEATTNTEEQSCDNPDKKPRLITLNELSKNNGEDGTPIWLSILGEVYDVTEGRNYYGVGTGGYAIFASRDATLAFSTGKFNEEEAAKGLDEVSDNDVGAIYSWHQFYQGEDKYPFVGLLIDERYHDENGNAVPALEEFRERAKKVKAEEDAKIEERKLKRKQKKEKREAEEAKRKKK